jgi:LacI family transcriptional regulator, galactose operon repressor
MAVTSKDIARELAISQSTVSRALRGDPRVAPRTIARVLEAAERMGYTPNLAARSLITRRTSTVGVVVSDITNPFYPELVEILHNEFALAGFRTILLNERTDARLERYVDELVGGGAVDGLVYASAMLDVPLVGAATERLPVVLVNRASATADVDTVVADNRSGGRLAAELFVARGHRRIGLVAGPASTSTARDRETGFREQAEAMGVPLESRFRRVGQFSHQSGYHWGLELLALEPRPTAVFAANDVIAFGVLDAARRLGVRVPEELSVIGFDDIDMARWEGFSLTTVRQPLPEMGRAAVRLLLERIEGPDVQPPARRRIFPVEIVHRGTVADAPAG